jgi:diguanylate cyclase (GGDEF)-like protein
VPVADPRVAIELDALAADLRERAWALALEVVEAGVAEDALAPLARLGGLGRASGLSTLVEGLAGELAERRPATVAALVRDHARARAALGLGPREVVAELLLLGRALSRAAAARGRHAEDAADRLVRECVVASVKRVTGELASRARRDPLTGLLNHRALLEELELELERGRRYGHGLTLVFVDLDRFKEVNDTLGHPEGDRVLRVVAGVLRESIRRTDAAGRMGGDEFAVVLVESEPDAGGHFLERVGDRIDELAAEGALPEGFSLSPGLAHFPREAADADGLFRIADARVYAAKRAASAPAG